MDNGLYLVCCVADTWIGLPAAQVEAVVKVRDIVPIPHAPTAVRGLVAIRSRLLTVVDTAIAAGVDAMSSPTDEAVMMAILSIDGYGYGLTLDVVDDVVEFTGFQPTMENFSPGWRRLASQMVDFRGCIILIIDPRTLVDTVQGTQLQAA